MPQEWYWWRSRFSRLPLNEFKLTMSLIFDFATSTKSGHEPKKYVKKVAFAGNLWYTCS